MSVVTRTLAHCQLTLLEMRADENCATPKWRGARCVTDSVTGLVYWVRTALGMMGLWEVTCPNIGDWGTSYARAPGTGTAAGSDPLYWKDSFKKDTWLRGVWVAAKDELDAVALVLETTKDRVRKRRLSTWRARVRAAIPFGPSLPPFPSSIGTRAAQMVKEALDG